MLDYKKLFIISTVAVVLLLGGMIFALTKSDPVPVPPQPNLQQIVSIKELHFVKHVFRDMFFLHRKNDPNKAIRAIAQVPATVTAFIDLKNIQFIKEKDSVKKVILPRASLGEPNYEIGKMVIRETRSFQVHIGKDLYPKVGEYLKAIVTERTKILRKMAVDNNILTQTEAEGKEFIEALLKAMGRSDIVVTFGDAAVDKEASLSKAQPAATLIDETQFGLIPI